MMKPPTTPHIKPKYRADIDGLRAIAVLLVVFNHLHFHQVEGGYVGVDVFFVISGYLIGSSLIAEARKGPISMRAFYERRIRRIFPALLVMLMVVTVAAYSLLSPSALVDYARSLLAALFSFSNFLFWSQSGYFDAPSATKLLLHTWSLAVEEQFYVLFPVLLYLIMRYSPQRLRGVLWVVSALTFGLTIWVNRLDASTAFFWSPLRAWELLAGVLISQHAWTWLRNRAVREAVVLVGVLLILWAGVHYTSQTLFPGWAAIPPCLGAALIIGAGQEGTSWTGKLLSLPPFTFIGAISYSLYLWHWPLQVLQSTNLIFSTRPAWDREPKLILLGLSFLLAVLSWWLVETPFRKGSWRPGRARLFLINGAAAAIILFAAAAVLYGKGIPSRLSPGALRLASYEKYDTSQAWRGGTCFLLPANTLADLDPAQCLPHTSGHKRVFLFGDSLAAQLAPGLRHEFPDIDLQQVTAASCTPFIDLADIAPEYRKNCSGLRKFMETMYLPSPQADLIILAGGWGAWATPTLGPEIQRMKQSGYRVIVIGPTLEFDLPLPLLLAAEIRRNSSPAGRIRNISAHLNNDSLVLDKEMMQAAKDQWHVEYISYFRDFCGHPIEDVAKAQWETTSGCPLFTPSGEPLLFDRHHLTVGGSNLFISAVHSLEKLP